MQRSERSGLVDDMVALQYTGKKGGSCQYDDKMSEAVLWVHFLYHFLQGGIDGIAGSVSILTHDLCMVLQSATSSNSSCPRADLSQ